MNRIVAEKLIAEELDTLKARSYQSICEFIGRPISKTAIGTDGKSYQIEIQVFWDGDPGAEIRVSVSVDDGGWRAFFPVTGSFIMSPEGEIVGG